MIEFVKYNFKIGSIGRNYSFLFISNIYRSAIAFLITILLARHFGVKDFGSFFYLVASVELFSFFADFGISTIFIREAIKSRKDDISVFFSETLVTQTLLGLGAFLLIYLYKIFFIHASNNGVIFFLAVSVIINVQTKVVNALFRAYERMEYEAIIIFIERTITIIGIIIVLGNNGDATGIAFCMAIGAVFSFIIGLAISYRNFIKFNFKAIRINSLITLIFLSAPLALSIFFSVLKDRAIIVILQWTSGDQAVGLFTAAFRLISPILMIPMIIGNTFLPVFSRLSVENENKLKEIYQLLLKYLLSFSFLALLIITVSASLIIKIVYGEKFSDSSLILQILSAIILAQFGYHIISNLLIAKKQMRAILFGWLLSGLASVVLGYFLSLKLGATGMAISYIITEVLLFTTIYVELKRTLCGANVIKLFLNYLISGAGFILTYLILVKINYFFALSFSVIIYLIIQKLSNKFTLEDFYLLNTIIRSDLKHNK